MDAGRSAQELLVAKEGDRAVEAATERAEHSHGEGHSGQAGRGIFSQERKTSYAHAEASGLPRPGPDGSTCGFRRTLPSLAITRPQAFCTDKFITLLGSVFSVFRLITA